MHMNLSMFNSGFCALLDSIITRTYIIVTKSIVNTAYAVHHLISLKHQMVFLQAGSVQAV